MESNLNFNLDDGSGSMSNPSKIKPNTMTQYGKEQNQMGNDIKRIEIILFTNSIWENNLRFIKRIFG